MGMECMKGHGRQNIVMNLTADGTNPTKMSQVIAHRLACGCVVGGEQYEKFRERLTEIETVTARAIQTLEEDARQEKAILYQDHISRKGA